jgi:hypothetical protein
LLQQGDRGRNRLLQPLQRFSLSFFSNARIAIRSNKLYQQLAMQTSYPLRLHLKDKRLFERAARSAGISLVEFLRRAAREKAKSRKKKAACLSYPEIEVNPKAEASPRKFIRPKLSARHR